MPTVTWGEERMSRLGRNRAQSGLRKVIFWSPRVCCTKLGQGLEEKGSNFQIHRMESRKRVAPDSWVGHGFQPFLCLTLRLENVSVFQDHGCRLGFAYGAISFQRIQRAGCHSANDECPMATQARARVAAEDMFGASREQREREFTDVLIKSRVVASVPIDEGSTTRVRY